MLEFVGLGALADRRAGEIGLAEQKRVQAARALAMRPSVLLLDEAMAGLNPGELEAALDLVRAVHRGGVSLVVIEHLMKVIKCVDELSFGLAPLVTTEMLDVLGEIRAHGTSVLLVDQDVENALAVADRAYVTEGGRIVLSGAASQVYDDPGVRTAYLGL